MNSKNPVLRISVFVIALFAGLSMTLAQAGPTADVVTIISNLENDAVKADLGGARLSALRTVHSTRRHPRAGGGRPPLGRT